MSGFTVSNVVLYTDRGSEVELDFPNPADAASALPALRLVPTIDSVDVTNHKVVTITLAPRVRWEGISRYVTRTLIANLGYTVDMQSSSIAFG